MTQCEEDEMLLWHAERICLDLLDDALDADADVEKVGQPELANPVHWVRGILDEQAEDVDVHPSHQIASDSRADGNVHQTQNASSEAPLRKPGWSVGAQLHHLGQCRPCAWHWKLPGCANGSDCDFCHACENGTLQKRRKERIAHYRAERERFQEGKFGKKYESSPQAKMPPHAWPPHLVPPHLLRSRLSPDSYACAYSQVQLPSFFHEGLDQVPYIVWRSNDLGTPSASSKQSSEDTTMQFPNGRDATDVFARFSF